MSNSFGYLDIILLAMIAGFIILRLRNILGRKTGHQDKPFSEFTDKKFEQFKKSAAMRNTKPKNEFDDVDLDWRLNSDGMLAVSGLMDSLVSEACGKTADKIDLPQASVPEQGISNDSFVYVLATPKAEFDRQIEKVCAR